jgi:hypothetical protein
MLPVMDVFAPIRLKQGTDFSTGKPAGSMGKHHVNHCRTAIGRAADKDDLSCSSMRFNRHRDLIAQPEALCHEHQLP